MRASPKWFAAHSGSTSSICWAASASSELLARVTYTCLIPEGPAGWTVTVQRPPKCTTRHLRLRARITQDIIVSGSPIDSRVSKQERATCHHSEEKSNVLIRCTNHVSSFLSV